MWVLKFTIVIFMIIIFMILVIILITQLFHDIYPYKDSSPHKVSILIRNGVFWMQQYFISFRFSKIINLTFFILLIILIILVPTIFLFPLI